MRLDGIGDETPVFFKAGQETLSGIFGAPARDSAGVGVIVLAGGWRGTSAGRNRVLVRLCRRLMAAGCHTFRFDYAGVGESTGTQTRRLAEPSVGDLMAAAAWLQAHGPSRVILAGFCYGAWTSLLSAPRIQGLHALAMLAVPPNVSGKSALSLAADRVRLSRLIRQALRPWFLRRLFTADQRRLYGRYLRAKWQTISHRNTATQDLSGDGDRAEASPEFLHLLRSLADRRVPVLLLYGTEDFAYDHFEQARAGRLGEILTAGGSLIEVNTVSGHLHTLAEIDVQESLIESVADWVVGHVPATSAEP